MTARPASSSRMSTTEGLAGLFLLVVAFAALRAASEGRFGEWISSKFLNTGEPAPAPPPAAANGSSGSGSSAGEVEINPGGGGTKQFGDPVLSATLVSPFGVPRDGGARTHKGIDLGAPRGTPVRAVGDGTIYYARGGFNLCGTGVSIDHGGGWRSVYCHLDEIAPGISKGGTVMRGQKIGTVGNSGNARTTGPHLHFELRRNGVSENPAPLIGR